MSDKTRVEKYDAEQGAIGEIRLENGHPPIRRSACEKSCASCVFLSGPYDYFDNHSSYCDSRETVNEEGIGTCDHRTYLGNLECQPNEVSCDDWRPNA